jgi:hypothetical protein
MISPYTWPILSVSSVSYAGGIFGSTTIPQSPNGVQPGWVNDANRIYLVGLYYFPVGFQNVTLNYTSGFNSIPEDVNQSVVELVAQKFIRSRHIDEDSQRLGDQVTSYSKKDIPPEVQTVIDRYKIRAVIE